MVKIPLTNRFSEEDIANFLKEHTESGKQEYLVRGALLRCRYGTHARQLNLKKCHGIYVHGHPCIHARNCLVGEEENITWYGICKAPSPPPTEVVHLTKDVPRNPQTGDRTGDAPGGHESGHKCQPEIVGAVWITGDYIFKCSLLANVSLWFVTRWIKNWTPCCFYNVILPSICKNMFARLPNVIPTKTDHALYNNALLRFNRDTFSRRHKKMEAYNFGCGSPTPAHMVLYIGSGPFSHSISHRFNPTARLGHTAAQNCRARSSRHTYKLGKKA